MKIVVANKNQLTIIRELAYRIWPNAYGEILSKEQLDYMLQLIYSIDALENQLNNNHIFLLVQVENEYIGFASFELNYNNSTSTKIQKLYVLPEIQGKGIGRKLIDYIKAIAINKKNTALILNVNKFNKAINFYQKYGFNNIEEIKIDIGNGFIMDDFIMEYKL